MLSLVQLGGMLLGIVAGLAADSLGLRRTMVIGLALLAIASCAGGFVRTALPLMAFRGVEGVGFLLATMPAPSLIRRLVPPARVPRAMGVWGAYMPLGTALALVCGPMVMGVVGWSGWWLLLGTLSAVMALVVWTQVPPDPAATIAAADGEHWPARLARTLRAGGPWLVALCFAVYSAQWLAVIGFLPTLYAQAGLHAGVAGAATALAALVNMIGNIASGRLLHRGWAPARLLRVGYAAMALGGVVAFATLPLAPGVVPVVRYAAVLLFSMVGGLIPGTLFSLAVRVAPGEGTVSTTVGWMQQWSSIGQFAGPPVVATVAARVGDWGWSGAVTGACALIGFMLTWRIAAPSRARA
jgi:MFS family permease